MEPVDSGSPTDRKRPDQEELRKLREKIRIGVALAVAEAIEEHRNAGRSIAVWRDDRVVILPPEQIRPMQR